MTNEEKLQELLRGRIMTVRDAWWAAYKTAAWTRIRGEDAAPWEELVHYLEGLEFDLGEEGLLFPEDQEE